MQSWIGATFGDNGEPAVLLDDGEQDRTGTGQTKAILAADRLPALLADALLGGVVLVEDTHGHEAATFYCCLCPHATAAAPELLEGGLYARVEYDVGLAF